MNADNQINSKSDKPDCFGILEKVFPMTALGLRQTPDYCFNFCPVKTQCLEYAMTTKKGIQLEEEIIERGTKSGAISFLERWSRKKQVYKKLIRKNEK